MLRVTHFVQTHIAVWEHAMCVAAHFKSDEYRRSAGVDLALAGIPEFWIHYGAKAAR
jgi:hypothetical protein